MFNIIDVAKNDKDETLLYCKNHKLYGMNQEEIDGFMQDIHVISVMNSDFSVRDYEVMGYETKFSRTDEVSILINLGSEVDEDEILLPADIL